MIWAQVALAALALAREVVKYLTQVEQSKAERLKKLRDLKDGIKVARKTNDTEGVERAIANMRLSKLPDSKTV